MVFPAPFGPISAVMRLRSTSRWSTSTAARPPNCRRMPSATRIGSFFGMPGIHTTRSPRPPSTGASAPPSLRHAARRSDPCHRTSNTCSRLSPKIPCGRKITISAKASPATMFFTMPKLVRVDEPVRQLVVAGGLLEDVVDELDHEEEDDRADDRALHPAEATQHDDQEGEERQRRRELARLCRLLLRRQPQPADRTDDTADDRGSAS